MTVNALLTNSVDTAFTGNKYCFLFHYQIEKTWEMLNSRRTGQSCPRIHFFINPNVPISKLTIPSFFILSRQGREINKVSNIKV